MRFDKLRRDACDIMIMIVLFISFVDSVMSAIDHTSGGTRVAMMILTTLFLIVERQRADERVREYRKKVKK